MGQLERELNRQLKTLGRRALQTFTQARQEPRRLWFWTDGPDLHLPTFLQVCLELSSRELRLLAICSLVEEGLEYPDLRRCHEVARFDCGSKQQCRRAIEEVLEWLPHLKEEALKLFEQLKDNRQLVSGLQRLHTNWTAYSQALEQGDSLVPYLAPTVGPELAAELEALARIILGRREIRPRDREVEAFLADLRDDGTRDSSGTFTLDTSLARQKLAAFQLRQPEAFAVHAIAAAVAGGARRVSLHVDSDEVILDFDGAPLQRSELGSIFPSLLGRAERSQGRAQELAVALNAASALSPKELRLDSCHAGKGWRLEVRAQDESLQPLARPLPSDGHQLYFRARPSWRVLGRFVSGQRPEERLVLERCLRAPLELLLRGHDVSQPADCQSALMATHLRHPDILVAFRPPTVAPLETQDSPGPFSALVAVGPAPSFQVCRFGLLYELPELDWKPRAAVLAEAPDLPIDLSRSHLIPSPQLAELVRVLRELEQRMLDGLLDAVQSLPFEQMLPQLLLSLSHGALRELESWPLIPLVGGERASLSSLRSSEVLVTEDSWEHPPLPGCGRVVQIQPSSREALQQLFPHARDGGARLRQARDYHERRARWWAQTPAEPELGPCLARHTIPGGVLGLPERNPRPLTKARVTLGSQGRPYFTQNWTNLPAGLVAAVYRDQLQPDYEWVEVRRDAALARVELDLEGGLASLYSQLRPADSELKRAYLQEFLLYLLFRGRLGSWERAECFERPDGTLASFADLRQGERNVKEVDRFLAHL